MAASTSSGGWERFLSTASTENLGGRCRVWWELSTSDGRRLRVVRKGVYEFENGGGRLTSTDPAAFDPWAH
jgi:hypothetical protein